MIGEKPIFSIDKREDPNYPVYFEEKSKEMKSKKPFLIGGIIILLILGGFAGVLASRIWDPLWNPFRPSPEAVLLKTFEAHKEVKTYHSKIYFFLDAKSDKESFSLEGQVEGDSDLSKKEEPKSHNQFSYSMFFGPIELPISGEVITIGDIEYVKLKALPFSGIIQLFSFFGAGQEMAEKEKAMMEMIKGVFEQLGNKIVGKWIRISPDELGVKFGKMPKEKEEALQAKVEELILKYPVLKPKKELKDEIIDKEKYYHYVLVVDKENLKKFIQELVQFVEDEKIFSLKTAMLPQKNEEFEKDIDEFFRRAGEIKTEILINKKTYLVKRIKGEKEFKDENKETKVAWDIGFSNYNQPVQISAPEESTSIMEIIGGIMGLFLRQPGFLPQPKATPIF